jgi:glycine cleavage system aminomethyltransferase T
MALISSEYAEPGTSLEVDVRGKMTGVETCALPFYKAGK